MTDNFEAEERAYREGLAAAAESVPFEPIAATDVPRRRSAGTGWSTGVAAAIIIGVVAVLGATAIPMLGLTGGSPSAASAPAGAPEPSALPQAESAPEVGPASAPDGPGEPQSGWRWESFRDVVVQVPADWGYDVAPSPAWCIATEWPTAPYVDLAHNLGAVPAILCEGVMPADKLVPYLVLAPEPVATVESLPDGWTAHRVTVGEVVVTVVTDDAGAALADQILATARQVPVDHNGCPTDAPPATTDVDLAGFAGFPIVVCAYDTNPNAWPGLRSSSRLDGEDASRAWDAVFAAPAGGGPDGTAAECGTLPADPETVLLVEGTAVRFQFSGCTGNGLADAGADGGLREVTEDLCRTLLVPPFWMNGSSGPAANRCLAVLSER